MQRQPAPGPTPSEAEGQGPERALVALLRPSLAAMGYDLVRVSMGGAGRRTLQVMVEHLDRQPITVDDCAEVSHALSAVLDVEDPIAGAYDLEVSSPGLDRPLTQLEHFRRFEGLTARVELARPVDGQRRFKGTITGVRDDTVELATERGRVVLPYADVRKAKLVLDDRLLAAAAAWTAAGRSP